MAGHWQRSGAQYIDRNGRPLVGARAYFYLAGTTTPLSTYRDYGMTILYPSFVQASGLGLFPNVYMDEVDAFYRLRITDQYGELVDEDDNIPIIGPTAVEGGGPPPPSSGPSGLTTGDLKPRYDAGSIAGWVRCNGGTIGPASAVASERANNDCEALFQHLWNTDSGLVVAGGRGASAAADWADNKTIATPNLRRRAPIGIGLSDTLGQTGGAETVVLTTAQLPVHAHGGGTTDPGGAHTPTGTTAAGGAHTPTGTSSPGGAHSHSGTAVGVPAHHHDYGFRAGATSVREGEGANVGGLWQNVGTATTSNDGSHGHDLSIPTGGEHSHSFTLDPVAAHTHGLAMNAVAAHTHTFATANAGGGTAHDNMSPFLMLTYYIKL